MSELVLMDSNEEYVITLKEITDLIGARHNDAMKKVEELAKEDGFGSLRKTRSQYESGKGRIDEIETYIFTKKQAIAVGARLNNAMLMKIINRLEELEMAKPQLRLPTKTELALMVIESEKENLRLNHIIHEKDEIIKTVAELNIKAGDVSFGDFAKNLAIENLGRNNVIKFCRARGYLMDNTEPYQPYVNRGYFRRVPSEKEINGEIRYTTYLTPRGATWLAKIIKAEYELEEQKA